ncbi:MAG: Rieske (2Fe-2S) domain protein [Acidimicrobiales bacterium]|nr:Rieske (2Fe-2S) domain protein [Acidimicrobiales bacterium]
MTEPTTPAPPEHSSKGVPAGAGTAEAVAAVCFSVAALAGVGLCIVYWQGGQTQLEGLLLAVAGGGIGVGIVVWAKRFMPAEEATEDRHPLASSEDELRAFTEDLVSGEQSLRGRRLLLRTLAAALAALGAALLFPIRSLGPRPGQGLKRTGYADASGRRDGVRVVRSDGGDFVRPGDLVVDGVLTVYPEGHLGDGDSPTLLIRTRDTQRLDLKGGREAWVVDGIIAYSKLCTHVGCPVGLYQAGEGLLLCPCHQSTFDVARGAAPVFGPATRPLPQLPLGLDDDGYLVATGDFSEPVGPGFWDRDRP